MTNLLACEPSNGKVSDCAIGDLQSLLDLIATGKKGMSRMFTFDKPIADYVLGLKNNINRNILKNHVDLLIREQTLGRWEYNGDPISFTTTGRLFNGQYRLTMISITGIPQEFLVDFGIDESAVITLEHGRHHSKSDTMQRYFKKTNARAYFATANVLMITTDLSIRNHAPSSRDVQEFFSPFEQAFYGVVGACTGIARSSPIMAASTLAYAINAESTLEFLRQVRSGEGLHKGDPAMSFRISLSYAVPSSYYNRTQLFLKTCAAMAAHHNGLRLFRVVANITAANYFLKPFGLSVAEVL